MSDLLPPFTDVHDALFTLSLPATWDLAQRASDVVRLVACEPGRADAGFRANATVVAGSVNDLGFTDWQRGCDELLGRTLADWLLVDLERLTVSGHEAVRRLGHHRVGGTAVTMEQVAVLAGGTGLTVTLSAETAAYDSLADVFAATVDSLGVRGPRG